MTNAVHSLVFFLGPCKVVVVVFIKVGLIQN